MDDRRSEREDALLLRGDAHDFAAFYRRHEDAVLGFFLRRTGGADRDGRTCDPLRRPDPANGRAG